MIFGTDQTKFTESVVLRVSGLVLLLNGPYKVTVRLLNRLDMYIFALPFVNVGFMIINSSFQERECAMQIKCEGKRKLHCL